jgi:hypothetical protein
MHFQFTETAYEQLGLCLGPGECLSCCIGWNLDCGCIDSCVAGLVGMRPGLFGRGLCQPTCFQQAGA